MAAQLTLTIPAPDVLTSKGVITITRDEGGLHVAVNYTPEGLPLFPCTAVFNSADIQAWPQEVRDSFQAFAAFLISQAAVKMGFTPEV